MWRSIKTLLLTLALVVVCTSGIAQADDQAAQRYKFVQDGELSKQVHLPTCEWYPVKQQPDSMVLAIHGLTLHGKRYEVLGRVFAAENALGSVYVVAPDMRGFGRNRNDLHTFCQGTDCKKKVDYDKTIDDMVKVAKLMHEKYPGVPLYLMGESLGASVCLAVAAKQPDLFDGLVLSGVAETVNPLMFSEPKIIASGLFAVFIDPKFNMRLGVFMKQLVSNEPDICQEMMDDPLVPKKMTLAELIRTDKFIDKTNQFASKVKQDLPVLILQGSEDKCVVPHAIASLAKHIHSSDQTMKWLDAHGHLLLETDYVRTATIDAITEWFDARTEAHKQVLRGVQNDVRELGGKISTQ